MTAGDQALFMPIWSDSIAGHAEHGEGPQAQLNAAASFKAQTNAQIT